MVLWNKVLLPVLINPITFLFWANMYILLSPEHWNLPAEVIIYGRPCALEDALPILSIIWSRGESESLKEPKAKKLEFFGDITCVFGYD